MQRPGLIVGGVLVTLGAIGIALGIHDWAFVVKSTNVTIYPAYGMALVGLMVLFVAAKRLLRKIAHVPQRSR
jgi:hypothetical protein